LSGRGIVRSITLVPWVVPGIVAATTWAWMFHTEFGIINYMLTGSGIIPEPIGWLTNGNTVMPVLIAINVWKLFPFVAIMVLAGLQSIPNDLYEAARVDGANFWQEVRFIMIPQVRSVIVAVTLSAGDLGPELDHHHLRDHPRRAGQPDADHADPDLPAGIRKHPVQSGCSTFGDLLRRRAGHRHHLHQGARLGAGRGQMSEASTLKRTGLPLPITIVGAVVVVLFCLFPFMWMAVSSIKTLSELYTVPPIWWPETPTLGNYYKVLFESNIPRYFLNSVIISVGSTFLALLLAIFASYGFARFEFAASRCCRASC
jgi:ABC-type sugar transport system permease subunit